MLHSIIISPLRLFFRLLYHQMAWTYDFVAWVVSLGMWKEWVYSIVPEIKGPISLELGHGPGHLQAKLSSIGVSIIGLDKSRQMGKLARKRLHRMGVDYQLVNGNSQQIPFPSDIFDQVTATFPTEYIVQPNTLVEIFRVLKPNGSLMIVPVAWITGKSILARIAAMIFRITGQAGEWDEKYLEPFKRVGFHVDVKRIIVRESTVLILTATKPTT